MFSVVLSACFKQEKDSQEDESSSAPEEKREKRELAAQQAFVFGQNLRDRVKVCGQRAG